ncbi:hypothetical protein KW796_03065 [Candidatus Parcubacteria bacterium]|nr:hypothetical protein [Candidatus Parcubacteria bacterium]
MLILSFSLIAYLFLNVHTINKLADKARKESDAHISVIWDLLSDKGLVSQADLDWAVSQVKARMISEEDREKKIAAIRALLERNLEKKSKD